VQQSISPLTPNETAWVNEAVASARSLVGVLSPADRAAPLEPAALDRAYAEWWRGRERGNANEVINALGAALGQRMIDQFGFGWAIVTDEHGAELAVHGLPGVADILVFPQNLIAKRYERGEIDFIQPLYESLAEQFGAVVNNRFDQKKRGLGRWFKR
jgi:hypothetical protein